jgi:hypothetical protein
MVLRAVKRSIQRGALPDIGVERGGNLGRAVAYFNRCSIESYAMAQLKTDYYYNYGNLDPRFCGEPTPEHELRRELAPGGRYHLWIAERDNFVWYHVEAWKAERAGNPERAAQLRAKHEAKIRILFGDVSPGVKSGAE